MEAAHQGILNRRYLRIKVLQSLYAYLQTDNPELLKQENEMLKSIDKIYDLYLLMLQVPVELNDIARQTVENAKLKHLPTKDDLQPNLRYINNAVVNAFAINQQFNRQLQARKLSWAEEIDNLKKLQRQIRESEEFAAYMASTTPSFEEDRAFVIDIYNKFIAEYEIIEHYAEEKSIYWINDLELVNINVIKTYEAITENTDAYSNIMLQLFKDREDDIDFIKKLYRAVIKNNDEYMDLIATRTTNWEVDRLAIIDVILMKMAIAELEHFNSIPVKVTLNEYIDLSKVFSTPKSKVFINGILDKLVVDLKSSNRLTKTGRGLME